MTPEPLQSDFETGLEGVIAKIRAAADLFERQAEYLEELSEGKDNKVIALIKELGRHAMTVVEEGQAESESLRKDRIFKLQREYFEGRILPRVSNGSVTLSQSQWSVITTGLKFTVLETPDPEKLAGFSEKIAVTIQQGISGEKAELYVWTNHLGEIQQIIFVYKPKPKITLTPPPLSPILSNPQPQSPRRTPPPRRKGRKYPSPRRVKMKPISAETLADFDRG